MTKLIFLLAICSVAGSCTQHSKTTEPIDPVQVSPDLYKILMENEYVRVVEYSLKPGQKDNPHNHPRKASYVLSGGTLRVYPENEKPFDAIEVKGTSEWSEATGKHYVENTGETTVTILLTEIKSAQ